MTAPAFLLDGVGLWAECRCAWPAAPGPVLLLDRDGVLIEDTGYVGTADRVIMAPGVAAAIAACTAHGIPVAVVTNQSGIARELYDWQGFAAVQAVIDLAVAREGGRIDAVFACGYHAAGRGPLGIADHPWRKPRPEMLSAALEALHADRAESGMIGDREDDMAAAVAAGVGWRRRVHALSNAAASIHAFVSRTASPQT